MIWQPTLTESAPDDRAPGFRLDRLEVFNWGTFHHRVWHVAPGGETGLLTGDIGSGKSTLVDALTTLLVPPKKLAYNKASGAEAKERSLRSYVLGYHKNERSSEGGAARPVPLRGPRDYSVILAAFHNPQLDETVTLAQVLWTTSADATPDRLFVVADRSLSVVDDFGDFGADLKQLRKRLKRSGCELCSSFTQYAQLFRRRFGIENESALTLLHQTVSMKSVGNLTEFVRTHMLEPFDVRDRIDRLIAHFDDLSRAHGAVLDAKAKIEQLQPLVDDGKTHAELTGEATHLRRCREALSAFFAERHAALLREQDERLAKECATREAHIDELARREDELEQERDIIKADIAASGGARLEEIARDVQRLGDEKARRSDRDKRYTTLAASLELPAAADPERFASNAERTRALREETRSQRTEQVNERVEATAELNALRDELGETEREITSLRERRSNLPSSLLELRARLAAETGLDAESLPFVGEVLRVRPAERDWEGVGERLLRSFAMSLLVRDQDYATVAEWVEHNHLAARLVYFRVGKPRHAAAADLDVDALARKLEVKPDAEHRGWIEAELRYRFDHVCCGSMARFRRAAKAVTTGGQVKQPGDRHEKDDRRRLDDRSRYVLGWTNEEKIAALEQQARRLQRGVKDRAGRVCHLQQREAALEERLERLSQLASFDSFVELDWRAITTRIASLLEEKQRLETASDHLRALKTQLETVEEQRRGVREALREERAKLSSAETRRRRCAEQVRDLERTLSDLPQEDRDACFEDLSGFFGEALPGAKLNPESDSNERKLRNWIQGRIDALAKRLTKLSPKIVNAMHDFRARWPMATQEVDESLDALGEYERMLAELLSDDLPRFERRFKELLNENTINEIAGFQARLNREEDAIRERIDVINRALRAIEYNPDRYIALEASPAQDVEVRDFRHDLRACTEDALTGSVGDSYAEAKFDRVRAIIERFRGRQGTTDADARWTRKVTDVRSWFVFSASERWSASDQEHEHYSDSGGKSGGQKEKLAYTVLAASLAYQLALESDGERTRSFRFVVIDEAFGRGTDESARYGLELFARMGLQLLVVTPLQKIHVIEPYVWSVAFVANPDGNRSSVRNLTIEEYRAEREARRA